MSKIAIIDLDGVCVDSSARFAKAEEAKAAYVESQDWDDALENHGTAYLEKQATDLYWRTAFTPDHVQLDTLMDGVSDALAQINQIYTVYFLTSRPETMRNATLIWLRRQGNVPHPLGWDERLIMKPLSQQYVKTPVWKAGTIEVLARLLQPDDLLVVDDEHAAQLTADLAHLDCLKVMCCTSLAAALRVIGE